MTEPVTFNAAINRYEMQVGDAVVFADVKREGNILHIRYVEAPESLRGTGAAGRFMEGLMQVVKAEGLQVIPFCGYAASWLNRKPEYKTLIAP